MNEGVCVSGDLDRNAGEALLPHGDIYVVPNRDWGAGDTLSGKDVTAGGANTIASSMIGGSFFDKPIWLPDLTPGEYDIILDDDRDGTFDPGVDTGIGTGAQPGITVINNFSDKGMDPKTVSRIKDDAEARKRGLNQFGKNMDRAKKVIKKGKKKLDAYGPALPVGTYIAMKLRLNYNEGVIKRGKRLANMFTQPLADQYGDLAADPPDPDFREPVTLDVAGVSDRATSRTASIGQRAYPFTPQTASPVEAAAITTGNRLAEQTAIVKALRQSREKFQGARAANNVKWAVIHAAAMQRYSSMLEENLIDSRAALMRYRRTLRTSGQDARVNVTQLRAVRDRVRRDGLTQAELEVLGDAGLATEAPRITQQVASVTIPNASYNETGEITAEIAAINSTLPAVRNLTVEAARLKQELEAEVSTVSEPSADAGGPYTGRPGDIIRLDATGSTDSESLTYEWDTDLDGRFDDATGPTPRTTFDQPRDTRIGVKVTDPEGLTDIDYTRLVITPGNQPPELLDVTPAESVVNTTTNDSVTFAVSAADPDGDAITLEWFVNGARAGNGSTFTLSPARNEPALQSVRLRVADTNPHTPPRFKQWTVVVHGATVVAQPTADAGGPYTGAPGGTIRLDATGSTDDQSLTYAWELDGDGVFNDTTGPTPEVTFERPLDARIGVKVTDPDGRTDTDFTALNVSFSNHPPIITDFTPASTSLTVTTNKSQRFNATATDPDGDPLTYEWYLDGELAGTGTSFTLAPAADEPVLRTVRLRVADDSPQTPATFEQRTVVVPDATPVTVPRADAGGPYTGATGQPVQLDATSSTDDQSLTYSWDTDLDGQFDDATGPTPELTFSVPQDTRIGVKVTDPDGNTDIDYASLSISLDNQPPIITDFTPAGTSLTLTNNESMTFRAAATDPDGDAVRFRWFVNGERAGSGPTFTLSPSRDESGWRTVRLRVADTNPHTAARIEQRNVEVQFPDRDGDGHRADVDCNDTDPTIHPGRDEIVGNGVDDDCDPLTLDSGEVREVGPATGTEYITFWSGTLRIFAHEDDTRVHLIDVATGTPLNFTLDSRVDSTSAPGNPVVLNATEVFEGVGGVGGPDDEIQVRIVTEDASGGNDSKPVTVWTGSKLKVTPGGTNPPSDGNAWMSYIPALEENVTSTGRELGRNFLGFTTRDMYVFARKGAEPTAINVTDLGSDGDTDDTIRLHPNIDSLTGSKIVAVDLKENVNVADCRASSIAACDGNLTVRNGTVVTGHQSLRAPNNHNWRIAFESGNWTLAETLEGTSDQNTFDNQGLATVANGSSPLGVTVGGTHHEYIQDNNVVALSPSNGTAATETIRCQQVSCTRSITTNTAGRILVIATVSARRGGNQNGDYRLRVNGQPVARATEGSSDSSTFDSATLVGVAQVGSGQQEVAVTGSAAREAHVRLTVVRLRHVADDVHVETCTQGLDGCGTGFDTDGGTTWYLATANVRAGDNDDVSTELRVDGERIAQTREGSSDRSTWDSHYLTGIYDSDGHDNVTANHTAEGQIREWRTPETMLAYSDSEIEIYELHGFEHDTVHVESNTDVSVLTGYSPRTGSDWSVTPPSYTAGDEGIELGTEFYTFAHKDLTVFPTEDNTSVNIIDLSDGDDTRNVTLEHGDLDGPYNIYTANTQDLRSGSHLRSRDSSPDVRLVNPDTDTLDNDYVKVEADKPVIVYAGPPGSDTNEFADVAYSIPTGPAERLVYAYAQNFGRSNDLQVFGFNANGTVNITSLTATAGFQGGNHHDFDIGPGLNQSVLPSGVEAWEVGQPTRDVWWGSGVWDGEMLRIRSTRPVTIINGDYDKAHFGAYVPFVRSAARLPPVARARIVGDRTVAVGQQVTFDGTDSFDQDDIEGNVTPEYRWDLDTTFDADGDGDPGNDIDATGPIVNHTYSVGGTKSITLTYIDDDGQSDTNSLDAQITVRNEPPSVDAGPDRTITEQEGIQFTASVTDPDAFDTHTATIEWGGISRPEETAVTRNDTVTGQHFYEDDGIYPVEVCATDDDGATGCDSFTVTVQNAPPIVDAGPNRTVDPGEGIGLAPATFTDHGVQDTHNATVDWGDGTTDRGLVSKTGPRGAVTAGGHAYSEPGTYTVTVTVTDDDGGTGTDSFLVTVNETETAPPVNVTADNSSVIVPEGETARNTGTFTGPGDNGTTLSASVGTVSKNADGTWDWSFATTDGPDQSQPVTVTVTGEDGASSQTTFDLTVNNVPPSVNVDAANVTVTEGQTATIAGTVSDPGNDTVSLNVSAGTVTKNADGTWNWSFATIDGPDQSQVVTVTAADEDGGTGTTSFDLTVVNAPPSVSADTDSVTVDEGETATNTGVFADPGNDTVTLRASVGTVSKNTDGTWDWSFATTDGPDDGQRVTITATDEDGASSQTTFDLTVNNVPPSVTADAESLIVPEGETATNTGVFTDPGDDAVSLAVSVGTVSKNADGSWDWTFDTTDGPDQSQPVTITATDEDGATSETTFDLTVTNVPPSVTADAGTVSVDEGETAANTGSFADPGADMVNLSASVGTVTKNADGIWDWSFETTDGPNQSQPVTITATDEDGATNRTTFELTVLNVAPNVSATGEDIDEDEPATVNASFTDPGTADTHTAKIDWGDGTTESVTVDQDADSLTASHVYGDDGDYSVTVTVTDDDGGNGTDTATVSVSNLAPNVTLETTGAVTINNETFFLGRVNEAQSHTASATDPGSDDLTFAWSWGTTTTYFNDGSGPDPDPSPGGTFPFSASDTANVTFDDPGVHEVGLTVTDDNGGSDRASLQKLVTGDATETRTIGFWRHQYSEKGRQHYSDAELSAFLKIVNHASRVFSEQADTSTFEAASETLHPQGPSMRDKAEAQALAAWLNLAAGGVDWNEQIDTDGDGQADRAFHDVIGEVESILQDSDATRQELERAKDLAEAINTHDESTGDEDDKDEDRKGKGK